MGFTGDNTITCDWCGKMGYYNGTPRKIGFLEGKDGRWYCSRRCIHAAGTKEKPGIGCLPIIVIGVIIFIVSLIGECAK